jgi:hypothetical protein
MKSQIAFVVALAIFGQSVRAAEIYVDNRHGSDGYDGEARLPTGGKTGPTQTLRRAFQLVEDGDTIIMANRGVPYFESISMVGRRHSGVRLRRFTLIGNGAVISGARQIPPSAWRSHGEGLWQMRPWRKGHYQILLNGRALAEHRQKKSEINFPKIPKGQWAAWRGSVYLKTDPITQIEKLPLSFAALEAGITLYAVHDVVISDVIIQHFRLDGINAHDRCRNITLQKVTLRENGRAGLAIGGTSTVVLRDSKINGNREHSMLITEFAGAEVVNTEFEKEPTTVRRERN